MRIPESKIEEIRESTNIVDIISQYVQLRKRGKNYVGLCPFHSEKTPSFTVSDEKQIFHCFGCGAGGDVFSFLIDYLSLSFPEVVEELVYRRRVLRVTREGAPRLIAAEDAARYRGANDLERGTASGQATIGNEIE